MVEVDRLPIHGGGQGVSQFGKRGGTHRRVGNLPARRPVHARGGPRGRARQGRRRRARHPRRRQGCPARRPRGPRPGPAPAGRTAAPLGPRRRLSRREGCRQDRHPRPEDPPQTAPCGQAVPARDAERPSAGTGRPPATHPPPAESGAPAPPGAGPGNRARMARRAAPHGLETPFRGRPLPTLASRPGRAFPAPRHHPGGRSAPRASVVAQPLPSRGWASRPRQSSPSGMARNAKRLAAAARDVA